VCTEVKGTGSYAIDHMKKVTRRVFLCVSGESFIFHLRKERPTSSPSLKLYLSTLQEWKRSFFLLSEEHTPYHLAKEKKDRAKIGTWKSPPFVCPTTRVIFIYYVLLL